MAKDAQVQALPHDSLGRGGDVAITTCNVGASKGKVEGVFDLGHLMLSRKPPSLIRFLAVWTWRPVCLIVVSSKVVPLEE